MLAKWSFNDCQTVAKLCFMLSPYTYAEALMYVFSCPLKLKTCNYQSKAVRESWKGLRVG